MKADESRSTLPTKHQLDHAIPTVIHHPEEDLPLLARWLNRAMENQTRFWSLIAAVVLVVVGLSVLGSGLTLGRAASNEAWTKLEMAQTPGEREKIAKGFPNTPAERWALLQAATEYFNQGFNDLPGNREAADPKLKKALTLFQKVAEESPKDSPQARVAALGVARSFEARNNLDKALAQYEKVASTKAWAGTEEAATAQKLARAIQSPRSREFYKDLYAFKPAEAVLPPGGIGNLQFPMPANHPPIGGAKAGSFPFPLTSPTGGVPDNEPRPESVPPPPPSPAAGKADTLPPEIFFTPKDAPAPAPAPKAGATAPAPELPRDAFSPGPDAAKPK